MKPTVFLYALACIFLFSCTKTTNTDPTLPFVYSDNFNARWASFENLYGEKGKGGLDNYGAKGHPYEILKAGEHKTVMHVEGSGMINRMWFTLRPRSSYVLRGVVINMYWDNADKPAVSVPFGDFFGVGLGRTATFENALFANAEGRSFVSYIQMPFEKAARIEIVNEMDFDVSMLFYDIDYNLINEWNKDYLYFHAFWQRDTATALAEDFEILPRVTGKGRFLGTNISVHANELYKNYWWGEGEVKIYLNGDNELPTMVGTGTEDYIGTGWGQGQYFNNYQGCSIADPENLQWSYYRFHIPDPIYFQTDCRVTIQQMGGSQKRNVIELLKNGVPLIPVTFNKAPYPLGIYKKGEIDNLSNPDYPNDESWVNFFRSDDIAAVSYFYLNAPTNNLPELQDITIRTMNVLAE